MAVSGGVSNVLIVHPDNPAKTVADVLAQARAKPGELTYSSGGVGTSHHMSGVLLELRTGVKLQHVPYRATPAGIHGGGQRRGGDRPVQHADRHRPDQGRQAQGHRRDQRAALRPAARACRP